MVTYTPIAGVKANGEYISKSRSQLEMTDIRTSNTKLDELPSYTYRNGVPISDKCDWVGYFTLNDLTEASEDRKKSNVSVNEEKSILFTDEEPQKDGVLRGTSSKLNNANKFLADVSNNNKTLQNTRGIPEDIPTSYGQLIVDVTERKASIGYERADSWFSWNKSIPSQAVDIVRPFEIVCHNCNEFEKATSNDTDIKEDDNYLYTHCPGDQCKGNLLESRHADNIPLLRDLQNLNVHKQLVPSEIFEHQLPTTKKYSDQLPDVHSSACYGSGSASSDAFVSNPIYYTDAERNKTSKSISIHLSDVTSDDEDDMIDDSLTSDEVLATRLPLIRVASIQSDATVA